MTSLFLSYARSDDEPFTRRLYDDLVKNGFDVWFDRVSMPSRALTFLQEIRDAITSRDRLVLVVGPAATNSPYVEAEWRYALEIGKGINPVLRLGDYPIIADELKLLDTPDFRDDSYYDARLKTLVRQLTEPIAPMGKLIGVPSLPPHLLSQQERLRALKDAILTDLHRPVVVTGTKARTGIHGMGGIGKSVLATVLARDHEIRRAFPDGVAWVHLGQDPTILPLQRDLAVNLGYPGQFDSVAQGKAHVKGILEKKAVLLILDDLWNSTHAEAFDILGPRCRMIVTTRDASLITTLGGTQYQVELLNEAQSKGLIAKWSGKDPGSLPPEAIEVIKECGYLPLALSICGAMVTEGISWTDLLEALREADLGFLDHPHGNILKSIKASIDRLTKDERECLAKLVVFPPDERVPEQAVTTLWTHKDRMKPRDARKLLTQLARKSLVKVDEVAGALEGSTRRVVALHDLIRDYLVPLAGEPRMVHQELLDAYQGISQEGWSSGPDDGYFFQHIPGHLVAAGKIDEAVRLLHDAPWISRKVNLGYIRELIDDYDLVFPVAGDHQQSIRMIQGALRLSVPVLVHNPAELATQLWGRLQGSREPVIENLLQQMSGIQSHTWLKPLTSSLTKPDGPLILTIQSQHDDVINALVISPDDRTIISGSSDNSIRFWDLDSGVHIRTIFPEEMYEITSLAISRDNKTLIAGCWSIAYPRLINPHDGTLKISRKEMIRASVQTFKKNAILLCNHNKQISTISISPDEKKFITGSFDGKMKLWDLSSCGLKDEYQLPWGTIYSTVFSPDGQYVYVGIEDGVLRRIHLESKETKEFSHKYSNAYGDEIFALALSPDGRYLAAAHIFGYIALWNIEKEMVERYYSYQYSFDYLRSGKYVIFHILFSNNGQYLLGGDIDGRIFIWDIIKGDLCTHIKGHTFAIFGLAVTSDDKKIITASADRTIRIWDFKRLLTQERKPTHSHYISSIAVSQDSSLAFSCDDGLDALFWNTSSGTVVHKISAEITDINTDTLCCAAFTHDSKKVFSATLKGLILSWDVRTGAFLDTLQGHTERVDFLHIIPGKDILISCDTKGELLVWDTTNGSKLFVTSIIGSGSGSIGVSKKNLIVPIADNKIDFISLNQFSKKYTLELTHFPLTSLLLSQDSRYLAVSSKNNTYTVYSMPENSTVEKMYDGAGKALCFSEDGNYLFTLNGQSLSIRDSINNTIESTINFQGLDFHSMKTKFNLAARTQSRLGHGLCYSGEDIKIQMREKNLFTPHTDNQHLFILDTAESVSLWNIKQNKMVTRFTCESDIRVVTFIHDRETLIIGDEMGNVHFLQLQNIV